MIEFERKVGPKGQIVIPKDIRRHTGIRPSSRVLVTLKDSTILIRPERQHLFKKLEEDIKRKGKILGKRDFRKEFYEEIEKELKK